MDGTQIVQGSAYETACSQLALQTFSLMIDPESELAARPVQDLQSALSRLADAESTIMRQTQRIRQLERLALTDELTGLLNRRGLMLMLERELERMQRAPEQSAVLVIADLDGFKQVNDHHGHLVGDHYLQAVARALDDFVRGGDCVARLGGDEFVIMMPGLSADKANLVLERLEAAFAAEALVWGNHTIPLKASFGCVACSAIDNAKNVLARADERLYAAKTARKSVQRALAATKSVAS